MNYTKKILTAAVVGAALVAALGMQTTAQTTATLACMPVSQSVSLNQQANIAVRGGTGTYTFSGSGFATTTTSNTVFSVSFGSAGAQTVTVASGAQTANCTVNVSAASVPAAVQCTGPAAVAAGTAATFVATGGSGVYAWSATNASIPDPSGPVLLLTYPNTGTQTVTVASGGQTSSCVLNVQPMAPGALVCAPVSQSVRVGQTAVFSAGGGTGVYTWSGPGLVDSTGPTASAVYGTAGTYNATVTSGAQTAACTVTASAGPIVPGFPNTGFDPGS